MTPILMLGAGRMGGALIEGWTRAAAFAPADLIICEPNPGDLVRETIAAGARRGEPGEGVRAAQTVLLAVKPQLWREAAAAYEPWLAPEAVIVSIAAGVKAADLAAGFGGRRVARVMPTTAVAICQGTASLFSEDEEALGRAHALFGPVGKVAVLEEEDLMHAATAVSGSAPAYLYAFIEALEDAGVAAGLTREVASSLARSTIAGAAALLAQCSDDPAELRRQVTSPGGTTAAALQVLMAEEGFPALLRDAVAAAVRRSKELGA